MRLMHSDTPRTYGIIAHALYSGVDEGRTVRGD